MTVLFHITPRRNLGKIALEGLRPRIGPRARLLEPRAGVFCFSSAQAVEDGLLGWLEREFGEDAVLALLKINIQENTPSEQATPWETILLAPVPPGRITVLSRDILAETDVAAVCAREGSQLMARPDNSLAEP